jgi:hypothetical protein
MENSYIAVPPTSIWELRVDYADIQNYSIARIIGTLDF